MCIRDSVSTPGNLSRTGKTRRHANILQSSLRSVSRRKTLAYREGSNCLAKSCTLIGCGSPEIIFFRLGFRPTIPFFSGISILGFCQLPNPKGLGRPLHRRFIVTCGCSGAIYCHSNTTLPIIFREWSRRFQGVRFISALQGLRVLYPLTPPSQYKGQQAVENIFKFIKDPTLVGAYCLKNPERIVAFGYILLMAAQVYTCLLYTSDAADDLLCVDLGGRRIIKKKKK